jgi:N-acyl-D-aspartate/D-glutamate deacylase
MHDLVIRGGIVVDGSGNAPRTADVAVDNGLITAVARRPIVDTVKSMPQACW